MPRLFRKFDASKSTIISSKRGRFSEKSFSQFDNNKIYKSGHGHGSQNTYLCINPLKSMIKNQEFALKKRSVNQKETLKALANLEDTYLVQNGKKLSANLITD